MSAPTHGEAVRKAITVRCGLDTAFRTWTEQIDAWWPKQHSRSGDSETFVSVERMAGGRIYERTPDGVEHDWGRVVAWDPPRHFAYHWYLGSSFDQPTRVDVRFSSERDGETRVEVSHRGPELIGELWSRNSARYDAAWEEILPSYVAAIKSLE